MIVSIGLIIPAALGPGVFLFCNRNEYQKQKKYFWGRRARPVPMAESLWACKQLASESIVIAERKASPNSERFTGLETSKHRNCFSGTTSLSGVHVWCLETSLCIARADKNRSRFRGDVLKVNRTLHTSLCASYNKMVTCVFRFGTDNLHTHGPRLVKFGADIHLKYNYVFILYHPTASVV
jgi:hypothetical protein